MRGMSIFLRKIDSTVAVPVYTIWEKAIGGGWSWGEFATRWLYLAGNSARIQQEFFVLLRCFRRTQRNDRA
jgi:hypothetical protein